MKEQYGIAVLKNVRVAMRDGVRLATDIHRPTREGEIVPGPFPTILCRTSYDKSAQRYVDIADFFTPHGYAVVLQDLRGRHQSEGTGQYFHTANPHEGMDGYDTVEWIALQSWSNGKVGTVGSSHPGLVQIHMALYRPPHLTAIWPDVSPINSYDHQVRQGGAMQLQMFGALFVHAMEAQEIRDNPTARRAIVEAMEHMRELLEATPFKPGQTALAHVPALEKTLFDYYTRGAYDEYWSAEFSDFSRYFDRHADIPATFTGGWYDLFARATPAYFAAMVKQNRSPQRLVMGPWNHTGMRNGVSFAGDVDLGPAAAWGNARYFNEQLKWFDRWLKEGEEQEAAGEAPVQIFVMGGGSGRRTPAGRLDHGGVWRDEQEWPLARTEYREYFLREGGTLQPEAATEQTAAASFTYDPRHPAPTIGASSSGPMELAPLGEGLDPFWAQSISPWLRLRPVVIEGGAHQKEEPGMVGARPPYLPLGSRADVLVFETEPLEEALEVTGTIVVKLWIASSATDTDFTAKLVDVYPANEDYPAGYHLNLTDSILRVRYRNSWEQEELMAPGEIYPIQFTLAPTSNLFQVGHRLRVDVSSSNFPRFDLNPNTGEPMGRHTRVIQARNTVYLDRDHPSQVILPVIPRS